MIKTPEILEYLVKNVSGISKYNLKKRLYDILNTFESMQIIEKVYAKKNNRAYRFMRDSEFFQAARMKEQQRSRKTTEMSSYVKIMGKVKLLKTRIQLKMNIKKNLLQKLKFYNFQIAKNKSLKNFRLKSFHEPQKTFQSETKDLRKNTIKLPFIALELIDGQPVEVQSSRVKSRSEPNCRGN